MIELQSDVFDTHEYLNALKDNSVKEIDNAEFRKYFEEYKTRYSI